MEPSHELIVDHRDASQQHRPISLLDLALELIELIVSEIDDELTLARLSQTSKQVHHFVASGHLSYRQVRCSPFALSIRSWAHFATHPTRTVNLRSLHVSDKRPSRSFYRDEWAARSFASPAMEAARHMRRLKSFHWDAEEDSALPEGLLEALSSCCPVLEELRLVCYTESDAGPFLSALNPASICFAPTFDYMLINCSTGAILFGPRCV